MIVSGEWRRDGMVALGITLVQLVAVSSRVLVTV